MCIFNLLPNKILQNSFKVSTTLISYFTVTLYLLLLPVNLKPYYSWFSLIYAVFYQLILIPGDSEWLSILEPGDEALGVFGADAKFS